MQHLCRISAVVQHKIGLLFKSGSQESIVFIHAAAVLRIDVRSAFSQSRGDIAVTGIGVNLNMTREQLGSASQEATSIAILTGAPVDLDTALKRFEGLLHCHAATLKTTPDALFARWKAENGLLGRHVEFIVGDGSRLTGLFRDIDATGSVILDEDDGRTLTLNCGDVRLLTRA